MCQLPEVSSKGRSVPSAPPPPLSGMDFTRLAELEHPRLDQGEGASAPGHCGAAVLGLDCDPFRWEES